MSTEPGLTWAEQEVIGALRRLARAQAQVAATREPTAATRSGPFDPGDAARLEQAHQELVEARERATGRFAKAAARQAVREREAAERLLLDRLQMATYDDYRARMAAAGPGPAPFDPAMADFARRELAAAWAEWRDVRSLPLDPSAEPSPASGVDPSGGPSIDPSSGPDIDLTTSSDPVDRS